MKVLGAIIIIVLLPIAVVTLGILALCGLPVIVPLVICGFVETLLYIFALCGLAASD